MRGVKVRVLSSAIPSSIFDRFGVIARMLSDSSLLVPIEFIEFGRLNNLFAGLNLTDSNHEKILVVGDTVLLETRNHDAENRFLDLSYVLKPLDLNKPWLGSQLSNLAENVWSTVSRIQKPLRPMPPGINGHGIPAETLSIDQRLTSIEQIQSYKKVIEFLDSNPEKIIDEESRPESVQAIANDFLDNALTRVYPSDPRLRVHMPDDIVDSIIEDIKITAANDGEIDIISMSLFMIPRLKDAILNAAKAGIKIRIFSNGEESSRSFVPFGLTYIESLPFIADLLSLQTMGASVILMQPGDRWDYLHLKLVRISSHIRSTVYTGSSNLNRPSTTSTSEVMMRIVDQSYSQKTKMNLDNLEQNYFKMITCEEALTELTKKRTRLKRIINWFVDVFF